MDRVGHVAQICPAEISCWVRSSIVSRVSCWMRRSAFIILLRISLSIASLEPGPGPPPVDDIERPAALASLLTDQSEGGGGDRAAYGGLADARKLILPTLGDGEGDGRRHTVLICPGEGGTCEFSTKL